MPDHRLSRLAKSHLQSLGFPSVPLGLGKTVSCRLCAGYRKGTLKTRKMLTESLFFNFYFKYINAHSFKKVKCQGHQAALLTAALARQAAAAVGVGTCWPWETADYVAVCSAAQSASAPTGGGEGRGISWRPPTYSLFILFFF